MSGYESAVEENYINSLLSEKERQSRLINELEEELRARRKKIDQLVDNLIETSDRISEIKESARLAAINLSDTEYADVLTDLLTLLKLKK